jgi:hypothetical protein
MPSIGLWRCYINKTITILDIIHRPVFYLKLNSTLYVCPYLTGNILRLRYEPYGLMLSIGLWRWYINISLTILDVIHRPVFYLKLKTTLYVCPYLTGNTLRLHYVSNRLMLYISLWRWYVNISITVLDIIHRPAFFRTQCLGDRILSPSSGSVVASVRRQRLALNVWPIWVGSTWRRK